MRLTKCDMSKDASKITGHPKEHWPNRKQNNLLKSGIIRNFSKSIFFAYCSVNFNIFENCCVHCLAISDTTFKMTHNYTRRDSCCQFYDWPVLLVGWWLIWACRPLPAWPGTPRQPPRIRWEIFRGFLTRNVVYFLFRYILFQLYSTSLSRVN